MDDEVFTWPFVLVSAKLCDSVPITDIKPLKNIKNLFSWIKVLLFDIMD